MQNITFKVVPGGPLKGRMRVPGDKSMSHRTVMLGSLAEGRTDIEGFLEGEDSLATVAAFRAMGVSIEGPRSGRLVIEGVGMHGLKPSSQPLYLGNSGTSMRLLTGILAGQTFDTNLTGDESLSLRPMGRVADPLAAMGAVIKTNNGLPPVSIAGNPNMVGIDYLMPVASAQVKSCLLLAGMYAKGRTCVTERVPTRDHTERMLTGFGYVLRRSENRVCIEGGGKLQGTALRIPGDISSAAFFMVGATLKEGSQLLIENVGVNPTRIGVINILRQMGADIALSKIREVAGEPVADVMVKYSPLKGIRIPPEQVSLAIDEFPAIFIAAAHAKGETILTGAAELRVKESDRIQTMADGLKILGIQAKPTPDGMVISGGRLSNGRIHSHGDHRVAMAFAMAGLVAQEAIYIDDCANVNTSFPGFVSLARTVGLDIEICAAGTS